MVSFLCQYHSQKMNVNCCYIHFKAAVESLQSSF